MQVPWLLATTTLDRGDNEMGRHEDKDKAEKERKIISNGHFPNQDFPSKDPGGKHSKKDEDEEDEKNK